MITQDMKFFNLPLKCKGENQLKAAGLPPCNPLSLAGRNKLAQVATLCWASDSVAQRIGELAILLSLPSLEQRRVGGECYFLSNGNYPNFMLSGNRERVSA